MLQSFLIYFCAVSTHIFLQKPSQHSKKIQHTIQINFFANLQMVFRLCKIIEQKFQNNRTAKPSALDFKMRKSHGQILCLNILNADKAGVLHRFGKTIALRGIRRCAVMLGRVFAQIFPAHRFVAGFSFTATEPAAFVA